MIVVPGAGRLPNDVLLVGEAPGREEAYRGQPFVGRSGEEQEWYLGRHGLTAKFWYRTNVVKEYVEDNPDPTPEQVAEWEPVLEAEIEECRPRVVIAVGRFAARWFLGESTTIEKVHGLPHRAGEFDPARGERARGAVVVPIYHPAAGLHDTGWKGTIDWDYQQVVAILEAVQKGREIAYPIDRWEGEEIYEEVGGREFAQRVAGVDRDARSVVLGIDTEGSTRSPWSIQVSYRPGHALVLLTETGDFDEGIDALREIVDRGATVVLHNAMFDVGMCRAMGLDLAQPGIRVWDSMYAAYLLRTEPQGLKSLAWRWCGMKMASYSEVVGGIAEDRQIEYLADVWSMRWPKPEPVLIAENDGTFRVRQPTGVAARAKKILVDWADDKRDKDGNEVDLRKRWGMVDKPLREEVEGLLGRFPVPRLGDVERGKAVHYAGRDADATWRLYFELGEELRKRGLG